ncbi:hypothetical protein Cgig2_004536 [Carnegiea gigantea]|uniref:Uncharacterized protein n=1 Tax=Carnegiea gigantea TaxID=171969 RepID=A0A9Q1K8Q9_9CARY|nr:hypothetical protein Cgig2_004536 [Carnegiea gigantea]
MESEIPDALVKMKLTAEEEEIIEFEEDVDEEKADQIALSLIGKLNTKNSFNIRAMKATFKNVWKTTGGLFFSYVDKEAVMNKGPRAFDGHTLLVKELTGMEKYSEVGKFVNVDENNMVGINKSLNFIANININKPLRQSINQPIWFDICYVKLSDFCYACRAVGRLTIQYQKTSYPTGLVCVSSLIASKRRASKAKKQEETQLL